jgi:hypothetical protein
MMIRIVFVIGLLVAIALIALFITQTKSNVEIAQIWKALQAGSPSVERFSKDMVADQLNPVQRYFLHAITPAHDDREGRVSIKQICSIINLSLISVLDLW